MRPRALARRVAIICLAAAGALALAGAALWLTTPLPPDAELRARLAPSSTRILDRHGRQIDAVLVAGHGWHAALPAGELPQHLRLATVAIEDATFFQNPGVAPPALARALWSNLRRGEIVSGGSTITQQLARLLLLDPELAGRRTLERKLREAVLALKLTRAYPKDEILTLYLNTIYYGNLAYGAEAAAGRYFGKPARDLSLAEAALLAGLPQSPAGYDPLANLDAARGRQAAVLAAMVRAGFVGPAEAEAAAAEPLAIQARGPARQAPHFVDYVVAAVGGEAVARGGLVITTTLDLTLQRAAEQALRRQIGQLAALPGREAGARSGAVVVLDPADGAILAMVGSPAYDDDAHAGQVNAALAPRQPGSAFKPLLYAAALERGWTPASELLDIPSSFPTPEGRPYSPQNADRAYHGPLSLREALATSSNVAAVRLAAGLGLPALAEIAGRLGVSTLGGPPERYGLPLALGSGEVTLLELSGAYGAFAAGGRLVTPYAVVAVDGAGQMAPPPLPAGEVRPQVLAPEVAYLVSDILADPAARARAFGALSALVVDRPAAVKTGTTTGWRDSWTVGYTPDRVVGVWVGNADGAPMEDVMGLDGAAPVWHEVMLAAHRELPPRPFPRPPGIVELTVCAEGGLLPSPVCPATRQERFAAGSEPTRPDDAHALLAVDAARACRLPVGAAAGAPLALYRLLPPEAELWASAAGLPRPPAAVCDPGAEAAPDPAGCSGPQPCPGATPALVSPAFGARFALAPGVPPDRQRVALQAMAGPAASLTFFVDGAPVARLRGPPYTAWWQLRPGAHSAYVEAVHADGATLRSPAVTFEVLP